MELSRKVSRLKGSLMMGIEVAAALGVHRHTLAYWTDPKDRRYKEDLAIAMSKGIDLGFSWWLNEGRRNLTADKFQSALYGFLMSNLFGFRSGASRDDEALQEIRKLKEQLGIEDS
jgi:hypothetical protein